MGDGRPAGYRGESARHRAAMRAAFRAAAKQVQVLGTRVRELESTMDRLRDRAMIPTPEQFDAQVPPKWQIVWNALKDAERTLLDLQAMYV